MRRKNYPTAADASDVAAFHSDWCIECDPENIWQQWAHDQIGIDPQEG